MPTPLDIANKQLSNVVLPDARDNLGLGEDDSPTFENVVTDSILSDSLLVESNGGGSAIFTVQHQNSLDKIQLTVTGANTAIKTGSGTANGLRIETGAGPITLDPSNGEVEFEVGAKATWYNTDGTDYERARMFWSGDDFYIGTEAGGLGSVQDLHITRGGVEAISITNALISVAQHFAPTEEGTKDCGASSRRWRSVYATNGYFNNFIQTGSGTTTGNNGLSMPTSGGAHTIKVVSNAIEIGSYYRTRIKNNGTEVFDSNGGQSVVANGVPGFPRGAYFSALGAAYEAVTIRGTSSQSANLTEWQDSTGATLSAIDADGGLLIYNPGSDATDYERGYLRFTSGSFRLGTEKGGLGSAADVRIYRDGDLKVNFSSTVAFFYTEVRPTASGTALGGNVHRWKGYFTSLDASSDVGIGETATIGGTASGELIVNKAGSDATNYERGFLRWVGDVMQFGFEYDGTGGDRDLHYFARQHVWKSTSGTNAFKISTTYLQTYLPITPNTDGSRPCGIESIRWSGVYSYVGDYATNVTIGGAASGELIINNEGSDDTDYERGFARFDSDVYTIGTESGGLGDVQDVEIRRGTQKHLRCLDGVTYFEQQVRPLVDNSKDFGTQTRRWKFVYSVTLKGNNFVIGPDNHEISYSGDNVTIDAGLEVSKGVGQWGVTPPASQPAAIADLDTGTATVGDVAAKLNEILAVMRAQGEIAT